ncbi:MAG TPA: RNB domain-containing ribonuclease [Kineosporiaceae bacterium]|nr:RNB domain-containing ribonuclease [Kineosporiaceae bacterium]
MVRRSIRLTGPDAASVEALAARFAEIRAGLGVPADFPAEVLAAAQAAAIAPVKSDADLTDLPFVTVDPPGSTDLDQAMYLSRRGDGFGVDYAIADVPWFVQPGGPVDAEAMRRGQTLYAPDGRTPLHPPALSEAAASLLPDVERPAFVWRFDLDARGRVVAMDLQRALVRSRHRLDYAQVQAAADAHPEGDAHPEVDEITGQAVLLRTVGQLRLALERERGGASLPLPEQEVFAEAGIYRIGLRPALPAEDWNAQLSLMTGMAAAELMLKAKVGLLRTLPGPDAGLVDRFRRQAAALGVPWPAGQPYGEFLRGLDRDRPADLALMHEAGALFRGAGYTPLDGDVLPPVTTHAAVAAPYAHVTAPLRRLVDRFGLVISHAIRSGTPAPDWARAVLPALPAAMAASDALAGRLEHACVSVVEAAVLAHRVGETFPAVAVDVTRTGGKVQLLEPAVLASASGPLELGERTRVRLTEADPRTGVVRFQIGDGLG